VIVKEIKAMLHKIVKGLSLALVMIIVGVVLVPSLPPSTVKAQGEWPPFEFTLTPSYADGRITYQLFLVSFLEGSALLDLDIHIPLPKGTRYVEGSAQASTAVSFDGQEVRFFTAFVPNNALPTASFAVEVVDPEQKVYVTQPWLAWKGEQPGDYLANPVVVDSSKPNLEWSLWPFPKPLLLEASAAVTGDEITYYLFPLNYGVRMWDLTVNLPLPEGTQFISAEASGPFAATFDGREVSFKAVELPARERYTLQVKVSSAGVSQRTLVTHAWAGWRFVGFGVGHILPPKTDLRTGDIVVQPGVTGWVMADSFDDVPFGNYDVSSLAVQAADESFDVLFYTRDELEPVGQPLLFVLYLNTDCQFERQYRLLYSHRTGWALLQRWNAATNGWEGGRPVESSHAGPRLLAIQIPKALLGGAQAFCGVARVVNASQEYSAPLPTEAVPDRTDVDNIVTYGVNKTIAEEKVGYYRAIAINSEKLRKLSALAPAHQSGLKLGDNPALLEYLSSLNLDQGDPFDLDAQALQEQFAQQLAAEVAERSEQRLARLEERLAWLEELVVARVQAQVEARLDERPESRLARDEERVTQLEEQLKAGLQARVEERIDEQFDQMLARLEERLARLEEQVRARFQARLEARFGMPVAQPESAPPPVMVAPADLSGELAVPVDNGRGAYDLQILAIPTGQELARIPDAHQPDFNFDGQRLLFDREGDGVNYIYQYDLTARTETPVTDAPGNEYPNYDLWGNRVAFGNAGLVLGQAEWARDENGKIILTGKTVSVGDLLELLDELGVPLPELPDFPPMLPPGDLPPNIPPEQIEAIREAIRQTIRDYVLDLPVSIDLPYRVFPRRPFLFVQCSLTPPSQESDERCQDVGRQGMLIPDQMAEIQGRYPVWTASDMIVYSGCSTWGGSKLCGLFAVPAGSTRAFSDGVIPVLLTHEPSDIPTDSKGDLIAFSSRRDGDWEAYVMNLDGSQVTNLSQSPTSNDGLPAISPDGQWVAFVSDRSGRQAVWVVPTTGGQATHLFDLSAGTPWAEGARAWYTERISWGGEATDRPLTWQPAPTPDYGALYPTPAAMTSEIQ
jgi:hypothetical protein